MNSTHLHPKHQRTFNFDTIQDAADTIQDAAILFQIKYWTVRYMDHIFASSHSQV